MSADLILTITDRSRGGDFSAWFREQGATLVLTALGRGTATTEVLDCLGLEATEKAVLLCMLPSRKGLLRKAAKDLWLDVPGRGVIMAVPVSSIGGASAKNYLLQGEAEDRMEKKLTHELIVVVANQGATDQVMDAARAAGATGGTAVHAKGTGTELAKKFFGVAGVGEGTDLYSRLGGDPEAHHEGHYGKGRNADRGPGAGVLSAGHRPGGPAAVQRGISAERELPVGKICRHKAPWKTF